MFERGAFFKKDDFFELFGGQRYGGISTPARFPYIFLIHSEENADRNNLDVNEDGTHSIVHFSSEGQGEYTRGNKAVIEHGFRRGCYNSIFLLKLNDGIFTSLGEYRLSNVNYDNGRIDYFVLEVVEEDVIDEAIIFHVFDSDDEQKCHLVERIPNKMELCNGMALLHDYVERIPNEINVRLGDYLDENYNKIDLDLLKAKLKNRQNVISTQEEYYIQNNLTPEEMKVSQYEYLLGGLSRFIRRKSKKYEEELAQSYGTEIIEYAKLYTINVGCGETNYLVFKDKTGKVSIWGFDFGREEKVKNPLHVRNTAKCIRDIKKEFGIKEFVFDKLVISHSDADHYNQVTGKRVADTEVWINLYGYSKRVSYLALRILLLRKSRRFVSLESKFSSNNIKILHPNAPIYIYLPGMSVPSSMVYSSSHPNDGSPLISIELNEKVIVFSGDMSSHSWKWYHDAGGTSLCSDVYIHAHHGSKNGFVTNIPKKGDTEYETIDSQVYILSTRDTAYSGIICDEMKKHPKYSSGKEYITDKKN